MSNSNNRTSFVADEEDFNEPQRPFRQTCCGSLFRDAHWKCLILSLIIWICLFFVIWCQLDYHVHDIVGGNVQRKKQRNAKFTCEIGYVYIPLTFGIMFYLIYLVECWNCHTRTELTHKIDVSIVYEHVKRMRESMPFVWWRVICYHYVRRTRQVTRYRNGDAVTSTQVYYERVNTFSTGSAYNFAAAGCQDLSRQLVGLEDFAATKIRFSKGFSFDSVNAEADFDGQRKDFFQENEMRDDYMECREGMELLNMRPPEYLIAMNSDSSRRMPWYLSHCVFLMMSIFLLSWPMRVLIEFKTAYLHYHIHKVFGNNFTLNESSVVAGADGNRLVGAHRRPVSISSAELDYFIASNLQQLPSYSEALLMPLPESSNKRKIRHKIINDEINDEVVLIANPLCRSSTGGGWIQRQKQRQFSAIHRSDEFRSNLVGSNATDLGRQSLWRNVSDSYIMRHCQAPHVLQADAARVDAILEENGASNDAEIDQEQERLEHEVLPDYETALFLPKISVPNGVRHYMRQSFSRQFLSQVLNRGLRRLSLSCSQDQCVEGCQSCHLMVSQQKQRLNRAGSLGRQTMVANVSSHPECDSIIQPSAIYYPSQEEIVLFKTSSDATTVSPKMI